METAEEKYKFSGSNNFLNYFAFVKFENLVFEKSFKPVNNVNL